jgi:hypothetical protein
VNAIRTRSLAIVAIAVVGLGAATSAAALAPQAQSDDTPDRCHWAESQLPRTPDAIEGWYRGCPASGLPHSPTGVEGWAD